jgi:hypothetical protein
MLVRENGLRTVSLGSQQKGPGPRALIGPLTRIDATASQSATCLGCPRQPPATVAMATTSVKHAIHYASACPYHKTLAPEEPHSTTLSDQKKKPTCMTLTLGVECREELRSGLDPAMLQGPHTYRRDGQVVLEADVQNNQVICRGRKRRGFVLMLEPLLYPPHSYVTITSCLALRYPRASNQMPPMRPVTLATSCALMRNLCTGSVMIEFPPPPPFPPYLTFPNGNNNVIARTLISGRFPLNVTNEARHIGTLTRGTHQCGTCAWGAGPAAPCGRRCGWNPPRSCRR